MEPWKKTMTKCRPFLVQNMDFENSDLWDHLLSNEVVTNIQAENIKAKGPANNKQVSAFLDHMQKRPHSDFVKMKQALRDSEHHHVVDQLDSVERDFGGSPASVSSRLPIVAPDAQATGINEAATNIEELELDLKHQSPDTLESIFRVRKQLLDIGPLGDVNYVDKESYEHTLAQEGCYPVKNETRGRGLVVCMTGMRPGWEKDVVAVQKMFKYINVLAEFKFDLKKEDLTRELTQFAKDPANAEVDCLFVVLMGHGGKKKGKEYMVTADYTPKAFLIREQLETIFDNTRYPVLINKPKVFLLQMCRGGNEDIGVRYQKMEGDQKTEWDAIDPNASQVASFSDYIIGFACQPGTIARRDIEAGTWYLQELTKVIMQQAYCKEFTHMLMQVNEKLEKRGTREQKAQVAECTIGLKKPLYLFPFSSDSKP